MGTLPMIHLWFWANGSIGEKSTSVFNFCGLYVILIMPLLRRPFLRNLRTVRDMEVLAPNLVLRVSELGTLAAEIRDFGPDKKSTGTDD
jgi:hypothetical protein